jgi:methionine aminopeptidase
MMHGVGLCDEWPLVAYADKAVAGAFDYALEPGMVLCVEALVSEVVMISRSSSRIRFSLPRVVMRT